MTILSRLAVLASLAGCAHHAQRSVELYDRGDYAGAARAADQELASHPHDDGLWQMRIRAALAQGDAAAIARAYAGYRDQQGGDDDRALVRDLAIATLGQALASPSVKLKVAAIQAVEAAELQPLAEQVAQRMADDDDRVVAAAAIAVLRGYPQAPQAATEMLRSEDAEARRIAVDGIGKKVGALALADLEKAGSDEDPRVRRAALRWLGELGDRDAVELLTRRLHDRDDAVRAAAATALARIGIGNLGELGQLALRDGALAVRLAGIRLMVAAHRTGELATLADDPDPIVAAEGLIAAGKPAGPAIERAAQAADWTVRAGAANLAVRGSGPAAAVVVARALAGDRVLAVRLSAARVLAHAGDRAGAAAVFAAGLDDPEQGTQAAVDLVELGDPRGLAALDARVREAASPDARAAAASAHRAARRITPGLVAALADPSAVVRVEAAAALAMLAKG